MKKSSTLSVAIVVAGCTTVVVLASAMDVDVVGATVVSLRPNGMFFLSMAVNLLELGTPQETVATVTTSLALEREAYDKTRAPAAAVFYPRVAPHRLRVLGHQREPKSAADSMPRGGAACESFEDALSFATRDSRSSIFNGK
jgi:hypothetical protein